MTGIDKIRAAIEEADSLKKVAVVDAAAGKGRARRGGGGEGRGRGRGGGEGGGNCDGLACDLRRIRFCLDSVLNSILLDSISNVIWLDSARGDDVRHVVCCAHPYFVPDSATVVGAHVGVSLC